MQDVDFNEIEKNKADLVSNECVDTFFKMLDLIREEGRQDTKPKFEAALKALIILIFQGASEAEKCGFFEVLLQAISPNQWSRYFLGYLKGKNTIGLPKEKRVQPEFLLKSTYRLRAEQLAAKWINSLTEGSFGYQTLQDNKELISLLIALQDALEPIIFKAIPEPITVYVDDIIRILVRKIISYQHNNDPFSKGLCDDMCKLDADLRAKQLFATFEPKFGTSEEHANLIRAVVKRIDQLEQSRNELDETLANKGAEISRCYAKLEYENSKLREFRYPKRPNQSEPGSDSILMRLNRLQSDIIPNLLDVRNHLRTDCDELAAELAELNASIGQYESNIKSLKEKKADLIDAIEKQENEIDGNTSNTDYHLTSNQRFF